MDNSFFDIFHQARRTLCKCPECGELSRLSEIQIKSGKKTKPTWLDIHQKNEDDFDASSYEFKEKKKKLKDKETAKGRIQAEKDMRDLIKNSLVSGYQQMSYDPRDIRPIGHPIDYVVFDGANKVRMKEQDFVKEVLLLSKKTTNEYSKKLYKSIHDTIQNKEYDWKTAKVSTEGKLEIED